MSEYVNIGKIANTHGIKGELKIIPLTDDKTRYEDLEYVFIEDETDKFYIEKIWYNKNLVMIKFKNFDNINDVLKFKNKFINVHKENLVKLPEDTYFIFDLIGIDVYTSDNTKIGSIKDVLQTGANDVYIINNGKKEILIPAVKEIVKEVNLNEKTMIIEPIEGLIE